MVARTDRMTPHDLEALKQRLKTHGQPDLIQVLAFIPNVGSLPKIQAANALLYYAPLRPDRGEGLVRALMYWVDSPLDLLQTLRKPENDHLLAALDKQWAQDLTEGNPTPKVSARQVLRRWLPHTARLIRKSQLEQGLAPAGERPPLARF